MYNNHLKQPAATNKTVATTAKSKATSSSSKSQSNMRTPIDWQKSSETVPYPDLSKVKNLWVKVSLKGNRTYLYDGSKLIYTMYSSGGVYQKDARPAR